MIGSSLELIATTENELKEADRISSIGCRVIYVTPELVQMAGVARSLSNGKYKICVMVDYPRGSKYSMDKFKGTSTDFFLADGYDIILTPDKKDSDITKEINTVHSFVKRMVGQYTEICYTLNASMREEHEIEACAKAFFKNPPSRIKIESQAVVQPTKANIDTHEECVSLIRKHCTSPIVISGNITYDIYERFRATYKIAISPKQYHQMAIKEQSKKEE